MEQKLTRRQARENAFVVAFSATFNEAELDEALHGENNEEFALDAFGRQVIVNYQQHSAEIDEMIAAHLKGWTLTRLPRVSLVLLRNALSEILYGSEKKPGVTINESVELAKKYGAEDDYQFINGLLGAVAREQGLSEAEEC